MTSTTGEPPSPIGANTGKRPTLVDIAREGRLVRITHNGAVRVTLTPIDESALKALEAALHHRRSVTFVYPSPAGSPAVLLAAQLLLHRFLDGEQTPSVGLLTADTTGAAKTWSELGVRASGVRSALAEVFPCYRADPDGHSPFGHRKCPRGILIGPQFDDWRVDVLVTDHLTGLVSGEPRDCAVRVFADPLDSSLQAIARRDEVIMGWSPGVIADMMGRDHAHTTHEQGMPFSVADDRLKAIASGIDVAIYVANNSKAEGCVSRIRDDLYTLFDLFGAAPPHDILRGIRAAWKHLTTLTSLPSRPSDFDRFAGIPPLAARATGTFVREISAWANNLAGDACEIATIIASDLDELRCVLEEQPPYLGQLRGAVDEGVPTLAAVRTQTAAHALLYALGGDPTSDHFGALHLRTLSRLYREGTWERAIVIGLPRPWEWPRLDSGLSTDLHILALGRAEASRTQRTLMALHDARCRWGGAEAEAAALSALSGSQVHALSGIQERPPTIQILLAREEPQQIDPFEAFERLLVSTPLIASGEDWGELSGQLGSESEDWSTPVPATRILTSRGIILLPSSRLIEVRQDDKIVDCRVEDLQPGMSLLISRREGRVGLLEAVADRLAKSRPDLIAAHYLIVALQGTIRDTFSASGVTKMELLEKLRSLGFEKSYQAMRGYVEPDGPIAPRDFPDLQRLVEALQIAWSEQQLREVFAGVKRYRVFRRSAGRALARAARVSATASDWGHIDPETGLSLADLREALIEAEIVSVEPCPQPVALGRLGYLEPTGEA